MSNIDPARAIARASLPLLPAALVSVLLMAGCAAPKVEHTATALPDFPSLSPSAQRGHDFAARRCSGCHTIGLDDGGAAEGPSFRHLARRYNGLSLSRRFREVSAHGFDRMPPISFSTSEADDLVAYFDTLDQP